MSERLSKLPGWKSAYWCWPPFYVSSCWTSSRRISTRGVNGWFADQMTRLGHFRYDPNNYHGPLHFYAVFLSPNSVWPKSLGTAPARHHRQPAGGLGDACDTGSFSEPRPPALRPWRWRFRPAYVFYGRYSIHESWMVLLLASLMWGILGLWQRGRRTFSTRWSGRRRE